MDEIFTIVDRYSTHCITYGLADLTGEHIRDKFYEQEIHKVTGDNDVYEVEKVLKTRKRGGKVKYFVKWKQIQQLGDGRDPTMNDHFFVTLPSESSAKYYPNNTVARFVTKLPETIRLQGQYEMALVEIIHPHNW
jgi:hypothetical protein